MYKILRMIVHVFMIPELLQFGRTIYSLFSIIYIQSLICVILPLFIHVQCTMYMRHDNVYSIVTDLVGDSEGKR